MSILDIDFFIAALALATVTGVLVLRGRAKRRLSRFEAADGDTVELEDDMPAETADAARADGLHWRRSYRSYY